MGKIFCIMGKSASGKDSVYRALISDPSLDLKPVIIYTTRPMRAGETDGVQYRFTDEAGLAAMRAAGRVIESRTYMTEKGPWTYFTADDGQIDPASGSYLLIGTLESYAGLLAYYGPEVMVPVYIEADGGERLRRSIERESAQQSPCWAELCRRYLADEEDFSDEKLEAAGIRGSFVNDDLDTCLAAVRAFIAETNVL